MIFIKMDELIKEINRHNPQYSWPHAYDFLHCLWILPVTMVLKVIVENLAGNVTKYFTSKKHKTTLDEEAYDKKLRKNIFKLCWNVVCTILGHIILNQLRFFPWQLLGNGDLDLVFEEGYPGSYFFFLPKYFDILYMINLCHYITDLVFLLTQNEIQNDFWLMVTHHVATIWLVIFSYWGGIGNVGCVTFHLHNVGNILVYTFRILMYSDFPVWFLFLLCVTLQFVLIFTRIYVFGKVIYLMFAGLPVWTWVVASCFALKILLWVMHVYWSGEVFKKMLLYFKESKVEDVYKMKKKE